MSNIFYQTLKKPNARTEGVDCDGIAHSSSSVIAKMQLSNIGVTIIALEVSYSSVSFKSGEYIATY
jgi:hypothetical protein